ncbi:serine/threonine-protein kinase [Kitasatospora cineracea]|uniref:serine/threonine-protein kinase n=1 Tax=Kitasatospora cineracea TaxID=88074 RepID=UPI00379747F4
MWERGTVFGGRYTLVERVGAGGMGEVWRADDGMLKRQVAVKIMQPGLLEDRKFAERFRREAQVLAALDHPGIVAVHDYAEPVDGAQSRAAYIVMEFIDGEPLHTVLAASGPMTPRKALTVVAQALDALHAAHRGGVVHRDIKPSNLMLRADGRVAVTDFGIARAMAGTKLTTSAAVLGTALYVAPEQADGAASTPLCDLYSIGVVCFELLTGRPPFTGETVLEVVIKHLRQPPPELSEAFPAAVREFVAIALAKDPVGRFPDAAAMAAAARAAAARPGAADPVPEPTVFATVAAPLPPAAPHPPATVPQPQRRPGRRVLALVVPIVLSTGIGGTVLFAQAPWPSDPHGTGARPPAATTPAVTGGPSSRPGDSSTSSAPTDTDPQQDPRTRTPSPLQDSGTPATDGSTTGPTAVPVRRTGPSPIPTTAPAPAPALSLAPAPAPAPTRPATVPATTPPAAGPPQGCGGDGWGAITGVGSGQRLGLAAPSMSSGTVVVTGRNTSYGWIGSGPDPGGWFHLYPCSTAKPALEQGDTDVHLAGSFAVMLSWSVKKAPTPGAVYLEDYMSALCLTDNGTGNPVTMEKCTPGNTWQQWHIPFGT